LVVGGVLHCGAATEQATPSLRQDHCLLYLCDIRAKLAVNITTKFAKADKLDREYAYG
jgi:hypothetical protein